LPTPASANTNSEYTDVDLGYLAAHLEDFLGQKVRTVGTVSNIVNFYMFEDFWLNKMIPVVVRFADLSKPPENSFIQVCGIVEYSKLEGGFYYLNVQSWTYAEETMPEFQPFVIMPLFMTVTLLALVVYRRKHATKLNQ
jgi:hypothetical protein